MTKVKSPVEMLLQRIKYPPNSDHDPKAGNVIRACCDCGFAFLFCAAGWPSAKYSTVDGGVRCDKCREGKGRGWKAAEQHAKARSEKGVPGECARCSKPFVGLPNHNQKFCSKRCGLSAKCANRRAMRSSVHTDIGETDQILLRDLYLKYQGVCQLCHQTVPPVDEHKAYRDRASIDHIIPLSKGGTHTHDNVQLAHLGCNSRKHDGRRS